MTNSNSSATLSTSNLYKHPWYTQLKLLDSIMTCESPLQPKLKQDTTGQKSTSFCFNCKQTLSLDKFSKNKSRRVGVQRQCKECQKNISKIRRNYQLPEGQLCQLCNEKPAKCWDHNHATSKFRGWLCPACNTGLGKFSDNIDLLNKAINYLSTNNGSQI